MSTAAQALASQQNAKLSTGPRTEAGKAVSRLNALRHGATSKAVVLPGEDPAEYERFEKALLAELRPSTPAQTTQAERVAALSWRLQRMYDMEASVLAHCMDQVSAEAFLDAAALYTDPENEKKLRLFQRYLTSAERAYNKALRDFREMQKESRTFQQDVARTELEMTWLGITDAPKTADRPNSASRLRPEATASFVSQNGSEGLKPASGSNTSAATVAPLSQRRGS